MATNKTAHGVVVRTLDHQELLARRAELAALLTGAIVGSAFSQRSTVEREVRSTLTRAAMSDRYVTMVAEKGDALCGIAVAEHRPGHAETFVRWLAVCPARRREGIGTLLADHLDDLVRPGLVRGMVDLDDPTASAFWHQRGWTSLVQLRRRIPMGMRLDT